MKVLDPWQTGVVVEIDPPVFTSNPVEVTRQAQSGIGPRTVVRFDDRDQEVWYSVERGREGVAACVLLSGGCYAIVVADGFGYVLPLKSHSDAKTVPLIPIMDFAIDEPSRMVALQDHARIALITAEGIIGVRVVVSDELELVRLDGPVLTYRGMINGVTTTATVPVELWLMSE